MKLITNGVDSAASDLQVTILDARDLPDAATGKPSEMSTTVAAARAEKPSAPPLMNGQSKNTLKEAEKLLTVNGFSKNIIPVQAKKESEQKDETAPHKEAPEKSPNIFDDVSDDDFPSDPSEEEGEKDKEVEETQTITASTQDTNDLVKNNNDHDENSDMLLNESAETSDASSIETMEEIMTVSSSAHMGQESEGLDDTTTASATTTSTTIDRNKLGKKTNSRSDDDDELDNMVMNDVDIKIEKAVLELENPAEDHEYDSISQTVTSSDDNGPAAESTASVTTENEQRLDVTTVPSSGDNDNNCTEANLSDIIVKEVVVENEHDTNVSFNTNVLNSTDDVVCKLEPPEIRPDDVCNSETPETDAIVCKVELQESEKEPQEDETAAFTSGENTELQESEREPLEDETAAFTSGENNEEETIVPVQDEIAVKMENECTENSQDSVRQSSEIDNDVIEDPLQDPLDTSFEQSNAVEVNIMLNSTAVSCDNAGVVEVDVVTLNSGTASCETVKTLEKHCEAGTDVIQGNITHSDNSETEIIKQTGEPEVNSNSIPSLLFTRTEMEVGEQNESEEAITEEDGEINMQNTQIAESITTGIQNPIKILCKEQVVAKLVEGTSRKRSASTDRYDNDNEEDDDEDGDDDSNNDDDSENDGESDPKRIRLFDDSSTEESVIMGTLMDVGRSTDQNEKRSTDDDDDGGGGGGDYLGGNVIKRIRLNSGEVLPATCELPETCSRISSIEANMESDKLDTDMSQVQIKQEHSLIPDIKQEKEDDLPEEPFSEALVPTVLNHAQVKSEQIEETLKKEVVYNLVGYSTNDVEMGDNCRITEPVMSTTIVNAKIVKREDNSIMETDKTPIGRESSVNSVSSCHISKPKVVTSASELVRKKTDDPKKTVVSSKDKNEMMNGNKIIRATSEDSGGNKAAGRVVQGAKAIPDKRLPLLIKFHKDQLKKLTRTDLEELIVQKLCEAITDRSAIGELRLRCQTLEQINDQWRKKAIQLEKQNRELEMVLKKYLTEAAIRRDRPPIPVKVTRSVGLQVILSSAAHGTLENARLKAAENMRLQQNRQCQLHNRQQPSTSKNNSTSQNNSSNTASPAQNRARNPEIIDLTDKEMDRSKQPQPQPQQQQQQSPPKQTVSQQKQVPQQKPQQQQQQNNNKQPQPGKSPQQQQQQNNNKQPQPGKSPQQQQTQKQQQPQKAQQSKQQQGIQGRNVQIPNGVRFVQPSQHKDSVAHMRPSLSGLQNMRGNRPPPPPPAININSNTVLLRSGQSVRVQTPSTSIVRNSPPAYASNSPRTAVQQVQVQSPVIRSSSVHPAPLPPTPLYPSYSYKAGTKLPPPKPQLKISKTTNGSGIQLSWSMNLTKDNADIVSYQLYAYQEGPCPPSTNLWKKVGDVKALPLPMACTLTQFVEGNKYHFAVRAVDTMSRCGPFSLPGSILLSK